MWGRGFLSADRCAAVSYTHLDVYKRQVFGIAITKEFWGLGIGKYLMEACIECAREAGYLQLELEVVAENERAVEMYRRAGFIEYGRNPKAFRLRTGEYQELIDMRLELK